MKTALVALAVAVGLWLLGILGLYLAGRKSAARELATLLPNIAFLFRGLIRDRRVSRFDKVLLGIGVAWVVSPIDLIPEFIPVVGPLDDVVVAALILRRIIRRTGVDVLREHWRGDPATLDRIVRLLGGRVAA
jgi:uncharacterized membrane protein YkvA (DUF1232 family)